jgi:CubicO group peptidase (beta-lactamase class C family)
MSKENLQSLGFDEPRLARVRDTVRRDLEADKYHGAAMMVARRGSVVLDLVEGDADRQAGRRLTRDAVFSTMSVAKQFTGVMALSLVERGALRLHAPIADWLPEFRAMGHEKVNLAHLLTHTSGICSAIPNLPPEVICNIEQLTAYAASRPLESMPGERVNYSILVGHSVIAALCLRADGRGRTYGQMIEQELFAPLKMHDSSLGLRKDLEERFCPVKAAWSGNGVIPPEAVEGMNHFLRMPGAEVPGGGCVTSIGDLHRFVEMLRRGGELDGARILSPAMIDYASRNQTGELRNVLLDPFLSTRNWMPIPAYLGMGFFLRGDRVIPGPFSNMNSPRTFGGMGAGSTAFWVDAERELSFAFLSTGLIEDSHHMERVGVLSDLVLAAMVD